MCIRDSQGYTAEGEQAPMVLSCGHSVCEECCPQLHDQGGGSGHSCPMCRKGTLQPAPNIDLRKHLASLYEILSASAPTCANCEHAEATKYCFECNCDYCDNCAEIAHRAKVHRDHKLAPVGDPRPVTATCVEHRSRLDLLCTTCSEQVCHLCTFGDHKDHQIELIQKVASQKRDELTDSASKLVSLDNQANATALGVEEVVRRLGSVGWKRGATSDTTTAIAMQQLEDQFGQLHAVLDDQKGLLMRAVREAQQKKLESLQAQQIELGVFRSRVSMARLHVEATLTACDSGVVQQADECLSMLAQLAGSPPASSVAQDASMTLCQLEPSRWHAILQRATQEFENERNAGFPAECNVCGCVLSSLEELAAHFCTTTHSKKKQKKKRGKKAGQAPWMAMVQCSDNLNDDKDVEFSDPEATVVSSQNPFGVLRFR
eukprot:TRINITY_DN21715_c0_g1_i1.p1 TRINITY_DN21715_c0_g1~~TRINITY_DN21715_c0_g1_i1.p1  ORF type:complete len:432 (+),score=68.77 TRINITY_DN21715_c0_g1_i1:152-1447(+)